jgi:hypothetical protein
MKKEAIELGAKAAFTYVDRSVGRVYISSGLTKREYFAAKIMQSFIVKDAPAFLAHEYAEKAVIFTDALLEELSNDNAT